MSSVAAPPTTPPPSVFISYASEDRAAARTLRDALAATGLDVWYDESELGGGDAWDQKIRRQIRDCDYFMPMISAATEARKEGYFRREWRLAAERTLDMADDVMFLLPVSIDATSESGARVPDKFLAVQWLRLPGGRSTPALEALCRRLLAGEHTAPPRPSPAASRPPAPLPPTAAHPEDPHRDSPHAPPPKPPFPHVPEKAGLLNGIKFLAEVAWWAVTAAWVLLKRGPRWVRVLLSFWVGVTFLTRCTRCSTDDGPVENKAAKARVADAVHAVVTKDGKEQNLTGEDIAKFGTEVARTLAAQLGGKGAGQSLVIVSFSLGLDDPAAAKFADDVFSSVYGQLLVARPTGIGMTIEAPPAATDAALVAHGKKLGSAHILAADLDPGPPSALGLRLIRTDDGVVVWSSQYAVDPATVSNVSAKISAAVLSAVPKP